MDPKNVASVSAITAEMRDFLENNYYDVLVFGEITDLSTPRHVYFTLKDDSAKLPAIMYFNAAERLRFELKNGLSIIARGKLTYYAPTGRAQFVVESAKLYGEGTAEQRLKELRKELEAKGYFDPRRKRAFPMFPKRVALITSPHGAAVQDMLKAFRERWPATEVILLPVRVQGEFAPLEIVDALIQVNRLHVQNHLRFCAVIVGRGGGSSEDLSAFNERSVAEAIFRSRIPVISAVGHETDQTIADSVADSRAMTPTAAVTNLVPDARVIAKDLVEFRARMADALNGKLLQLRARLQGLAHQRIFREPMDFVRHREQRLDDLNQRLQRSLSLFLERRKQKLSSLLDQLETLGPMNVLRRGFAIASKAESSQIVRSIEDLQIDEDFRLRLPDGEIKATVRNKVEIFSPKSSLRANHDQ